MKPLGAKFRLNGLSYTLLKRSDVVGLYGIGGTNNEKISYYEVDVIYIRKDKYGKREHVAKNDDFGRDRSRCYKRKDLSYDYFDKLTGELRNEKNLSQGVAKVIAGVEENLEVVSEYQTEVICEPCY